MVIVCPGCGRSAKIAHNTAGQTVRCTGCRQAFPVPPGTAELLVEWGPIGAGTRTPLVPGRTFTIGRSSDNTLSLPGPLVSRHHAQLAWNGSEWRLRDSGSANGTFVNGMRVDDLGLADGSCVVIGEFSLRLTVASSRPSDMDTALDAMALSESRAGMMAVVDRERGRAGLGDSQSDTVRGLPALNAPNASIDRPPRTRAWWEHWIVVATLIVATVVAAVLVGTCLTR
jgi:hypothetical protein